MPRLQLARGIGHLPPFRGQGRLVNVIVRFRPLESHVEAVERLPNGMRMHVDTRSYLEREVYLYGGYENAYARALDRLFRSGVVQGDVAADLGANVGVYTLLLAPRFATVHAFEPQSRIAARLEENLRLNGLTNVRVHRAAAGSMFGEATLFEAAEEAENHGLASLMPDVFTAEGRAHVTETIPIVRVDDVLGDDVSHVGFVKIDVEGAELDALAGMPETIERSRPLIFLEVDERNLGRAGHSREAVFAWFRDHDYRMCDPLSLAGVGSPEEAVHENLLAVPAELERDVRLARTA